MVWDYVEILWELDKNCFGFGMDLVNYSAAVFSIEQWWKIWLLAIHMKSNEAQIFKSAS